MSQNLSRMHVVIDKSYLDGAPAAAIRELCAQGALMTDTLFAELVTAAPSSRRRCFAKFAPTANPVALIPGIGDLLSYESMKRKPCTPVHERQIPTRFSFHPGLGPGTYEFRGANLEVVRGILQETRERVAQFAGCASAVSSFFPELRGFPANGPRELVDAVKEKIASDSERVRAAYSAILAGMEELLSDGALEAPPDYTPPPRAEDVDENWLWFRLIQVDLLVAVEAVRKQGAEFVEQSVRLEHDLMDAEYVAIAALTGGLASRDKAMQVLFGLVCPNGFLVT